MLQKKMMCLITCLALMFGTLPVLAATGEAESNWTLIWSDEFDGSEIDLSKWNYDLGTGSDYGMIGWGNNEWQYYTDRPQNSYIEDGKLVLQALEEEFEGSSYTSAKLHTRGKAAWTYGRFEFKAKLPAGQGIWPAIWMMPVDSELYGGWPNSGEIDIMEYLGHEEGTVHGTLHYGAPHTYTGAFLSLPEGKSFADDYHVFAFEWEPGEMRWYVDDQLYLTQNDWFTQRHSEAAEYTYPAPFDRDFYLQLNVAVGGNWPGYPDETTQFPQIMKIDYVRVYELTGREYREPGEGPRVAVYSDLEPLRPPLRDGNYVYNGSFREEVDGVVRIAGVPNTAYWTFLTLPEFMGEATPVLDADGLRVDIKKVGTAPWSAQVIQKPVHLRQGKRYSISFDAKASVPREIQVKITSGGEGGWADYVAEQVGLSNSWERYSFDFIMNHSSHSNARLEFNLGGNPESVWLADIRLEALEIKGNILREPLTTGNYIYNGTFDQGFERMIFWEYKVDDTAAAILRVGKDIPDRELRAEITRGGDSAESIQLIQDSLHVEHDQFYLIQFDARAAENRTIQVNVGSADGVVYYSENETFQLTPAMQTYQFQFQMGAESDRNGQLRFNLGLNENDVYIDNVSMVMLKKARIVAGDLIKNGDFNQGIEHWDHFFADWEGAWSELAINDCGQLEIEIRYEGAAFWGTQFSQEGFLIEQGRDYRLSFDAKSTVDREVRVSVEQDGGNPMYMLAVVDLGTEMKHYSIDFTMDELTNRNGKLTFCLGNISSPIGVEHIVVLDNIRLIEIDPALDWGNISAHEHVVTMGEKKIVVSPTLINGMNFGNWMVVYDLLPEYQMLNIPLLRFPAGNYGDDHLLSEAALKLFLMVSNSLDAIPMVQHNVFKGDPSEAAKWVAYAKENNLGIRHWFIGNEPDLYSTNRGQPIWTPEYYSTLFREYVRAIKEVDPEAVIIGPAVTGTPNERWLKTFLTITGDMVDILAWQWYPTDGSGAEKDALSTAQNVGEHISMFRSWIKDPEINPLGHEREIPLFLSEFGLSWRTNHARFLTDMTAALWLAEVYGEMVHAEMEYAAYFALQGTGGHGLFDVALWPRPTYFVTWMLAQMGSSWYEVEQVAARDSLVLYGAQTNEEYFFLVINKEKQVQELTFPQAKGKIFSFWVNDQDQEEIAQKTWDGVVEIVPYSVTLVKFGRVKE